MHTLENIQLEVPSAIGLGYPFELDQPDAELPPEWRQAHRVHPVRGMVSCVVPALNEHDNLAVLLARLAHLLQEQCASWEIIVVDDGSTDATPQSMIEWTATEGIRYLQLSRNFGKEAALVAGLEAADGDVVVCLDADLQHPLELIPQMLQRWQRGADMVYAMRSDRNDEGPLKRLGSWAFYRMLGSTRQVRVPPHAGDFRLMDRKVVDTLVALPERTRFMKGLYAWVGFRTEALPYTPSDRLYGRSHYDIRRLLALAADGMTAFTTWPLRMVGLVGIGFAVVSVGYALFLVASYLLYGNEASGWTTIVTALLFFAGVNLVFLGVMGEYLARIFDEVKGRPLFVVRQRRGRGHGRPLHRGRAGGGA